MSVAIFDSMDNGVGVIRNAITNCPKVLNVAH
jgi:hypothetical protein